MRHHRAEKPEVIKTWFSCYNKDMPFLLDLMTKRKNLRAAAGGLKALGKQAARCFTLIRKRGSYPEACPCCQIV
jgi:hypothetical protein